MIYASPSWPIRSVSWKLKSNQPHGWPFDRSPALSITSSSLPLCCVHYPHALFAEFICSSADIVRQPLGARELWLLLVRNSRAPATFVNKTFLRGHLPGNP